MGDRYYLTLNCVYCNKTSYVFYAPTCCFYDFVCQTTEEFYPLSMQDDNEFIVGKTAQMGCGKINFITASFSVKKIEEVTEDDVVQAFEMATSVSHSQRAIRREAKQYIKDLQKRL